METISIENVCRMCLAERTEFSEPFSNWVNNLLLIFGLEVFLDDELPKQICYDCSYTITIAAKLRDTAYKTDTLLKNYHKTDIKANLKNEFLEFPLNNATNKFNEPADVFMEAINFANVCRLCLKNCTEFSEPLTNWVNNVLLIFGLEVFLDDGFPRQICSDCCRTIMITIKLRKTVYETDKLLKTYHKPDIKPDLHNNLLNFANNIKKEPNEAADENSNKNNARYSAQYTYDIVETVDVKLNYPTLDNLVMSTNTVIINRQSIVKSKMRVMLEKLPDYISSSSLVYCSICLLAFTDREKFNIHLNLKIHTTNKCSFCGIKYERVAYLWNHINSVHVNEILGKADDNTRNVIKVEEKIKLSEELKLIDEKQLKYHTDMSEEKEKKNIEFKCKTTTYLNEEQRKKNLENRRKRRANLTEEQRKTHLENRRKRFANLTEEQREAKLEYNRKYRANMTEEQKKKIAESDRKRFANMTEEQRKKSAEHRREWRANITEEQRKKKVERGRKWRANMTVEQREKLANYLHEKRVNMTKEQREKLAKLERERQAKKTEEQLEKTAQRQRERYANMTEEQRIKCVKYQREWQANMTEEQRKKNAERNRKRYANLTQEQRENLAKRRRERHINMMEKRRKERGQE